MILATSLTWRQGQEECEKLGGYLAEIKSEKQQAFLVSFKILFMGYYLDNCYFEDEHSQPGGDTD